MAETSRIYGQSLALLTDLYQLTMAYGYWKSGLAEREAVFHLFFRRNPFEGGYALSCGLEQAIDYVRNARFLDDDIEYLSKLEGGDGNRLFSDEFLDYLGALEFTGDIDAIPEGTVVFAHEPLVRVRAPILQCQLLETPLLNIVNFQTLIATKAARICHAARGQSVIEFGLRRAQGVDGALSASRSAYVGGAGATSNVLAGKLFGIPVRGTHAHSWVMVFDDEIEAFAAYAAAMPNNCVFLVDTYDTLEGVKNAIEVGKSLASSGQRLAGIRLDSGDLAHLSIEARKLLDAAGFHDTVIVASNDLDEHVISSLKDQGATIAVWGVGTRLATAYDQPALGGVYKLAALRNGEGDWAWKIKLSEQPIKISTPGILQVRRYVDGDRFVADAIFDDELGRDDSDPIFDVEDVLRKREVPAHTHVRDLLKPIFRAGKLEYEVPPLAEVRRRAWRSLASLSDRSKRALNPQTYVVGLDQKVHDRKTELIIKARQQGT
ncbi:MAG: nicotinate phosphoribosyltransferase [Deltaproteobacteria bacterium]|nr:nicotinate phosphoribosyltransferase [Deltaproteobacteria bacterium]